MKQTHGKLNGNIGAPERGCTKNVHTWGSKRVEKPTMTKPAVISTGKPGLEEWCDWWVNGTKLTYRERVGKVGRSLRGMREPFWQTSNGSRPRVKCWQGLVLANVWTTLDFHASLDLVLRLGWSFFLGRGSGSVEVGFRLLGNIRGTFKTRECAG